MEQAEEQGQRADPSRFLRGRPTFSALLQPPLLSLYLTLLPLGRFAFSHGHWKSDPKMSFMQYLEK